MSKDIRLNFHNVLYILKVTHSYRRGQMSKDIRLGFYNVFYIFNLVLQIRR